MSHEVFNVIERALAATRLADTSTRDGRALFAWHVLEAEHALRAVARSLSRSFCATPGCQRASIMRGQSPGQFFCARCWEERS